MRHTRDFILAGLSAVVLSACGPDKQPEPGPQAAATSTDQGQEGLTHGLSPEQAALPLVKVGEVVITLGQFADRLGSQSPYLRARYASPERRREFLDNMVRFELLALEAKKRGYEAKPEVSSVRRKMMVQQMMKDLFDEKGVKLGDITDADIQSYYQAHADEFAKPEQVRASHIQVKTQAEAKRLHAQLAKEPNDMQLFRKLAKEHNLDAETKERFGDLRFFSAKPQPDDGDENIAVEVRTAAFAIKATGGMAPAPVKSASGFHVVKLTGRRAAMNRTLEDARRLIQNRLWRKRREQAIEAFVSDLRGKADVKQDDSMLKDLVVAPTAPAKANPAPKPAAAAEPAAKGT